MYFCATVDRPKQIGIANGVLGGFLCPSKLFFLFCYFSEQPCCWTPCSNWRNLPWKGYTYFLVQCSKCELNMFLCQSYVQIYEISSQDFHGFSHRRLIWQTRLAKLLLERYEHKLNILFHLWVSVSLCHSQPPWKKKKRRSPHNLFFCGVYCFRFGKESGMTSTLLGRNLQLKLLTKEYLETSVKNTQN